MNRSGNIFSLVILVLLLASCSRTVTVTVPVTYTTCKLNLQVFIRQGPNINWTVSGLAVVRDGSSAGESAKGIEENGVEYTISFDFDGRAIQFILHTIRGNIFGTGMMENDSAVCSGIGGGTLSGPALGDLGDWRGEWVSETFTTTREQTQDKPLPYALICLGTAIFVVILFIATFYFHFLAPYKPKTTSDKGQTGMSKISSLTVRRIDRAGKSGNVEAAQPLAEYFVRYSADDQLFDLSFEINKASRYIGEFGVTIAKALDSKSNRATALEIWLFGTQSAQTTSKILMSDYCNSQSTLRSEMERKGVATLIQPGATFTLEVQGITVKAQIFQLEYETNTPNSNSVFKKVEIKIGAWANAS